MGSDQSKFKYEPQSDLLGRLKLEAGEELVATFRFEPQEWEKPFWADNSKPIGVGSVTGVGHLTNRRLVLFWDVNGPMKQEIGEHAVEFGGKALEHAGKEIIGGVLSVLSTMSERARKLMQKNANHFPPHGIGTWTFPSSANNEEYLAKTKYGAYFPVTRDGPYCQMTFRPDFFDGGWKVDGYGEEFENMLRVKLGVLTRRVDKVRYNAAGKAEAYLMDN